VQFRELEVADLARKQFIIYRGFMRPELEVEHWFPTEVADYLQDFYDRHAAEGGGLRDGGLTLIGCACRLPSRRHRPVDE
jgi:hypothetical protein